MRSADTPFAEAMHVKSADIEAIDASAEEAAESSFPLVVAAVDVGSNALRFVSAEFSSATEYRVLAEDRMPVRLGHDVFLSGRLAASAREAAVAALQGFRMRIEADGIRHYRAVATSAVREASNGAEFVEQVRSEAGLDLEVITGAEEARLVHIAVRSRVSLDEGRWVLVDLGGGSVEVSLVDENGIHWSESHAVGSVRLLEELSAAGTEPGRFRDLLEDYTATLKFPGMLGQWKVSGIVATGGNSEALARLAGATRGTNGVSTLPLAALRTLIERLAQLSYRQRVEELGLRPDRADVILPAAMIYERVASLAGGSGLLVPYVGVKEGTMLDLVDDITRHRSHTDRLDRVAYTGAVVLGRRYMFDEAHAVHVAGLATELFNSLVPVHQLGDADRRILGAAALLHDIGVYVSHKKHHKHSLYLIANAELPGFTPGEMLLVANVARYHRKGEPAPHHVEYMALVEEERLRVRKLASLLRIAAALDKEHRQRVQRIRAKVAGPRVELGLEGDGDLLLERWALERNREMFERTYGMALEIAVAAGR